VLIDGYNVIRADPALSALEQDSLDDARTALLRSVAAWPRFRDDAVTVVFDGAGTRSFTANQRLGHMTASFPPAGVSADDLIKARAQMATNPRLVVVVTNDADIRDFCAGLGCTVTGSENLLGQLTSPRKARPARAGVPEDRDWQPEGGKPKKGNPRRLPKRLRNKGEYRF